MAKAPAPTATINTGGRQHSGSLGFDTFQVLDLDTDPGTGRGNRHNRACQLIGSHLGLGEDPEAVLAKALTWGKRRSPAMDDD